MRVEVEIGCLTSTSIRTREAGREFLDLLFLETPSWAPDFFNTFEPINKPLDAGNLEPALEEWDWNFLWRKKRPRVQGSLWTGSDIHDSVFVSTSKTGFSGKVALQFFESMCRTFAVDLGYIHISSGLDVEDLEHYKVHLMPFSQGLTTHDLRRGLPGLCWATVFGRPYMELFGDRLDDVPVEKRVQLEDAIYLQLTPDIADVVADRETYEARRDAAKRHLDSGAFVDPQRTEPARVPAFRLPPRKWTDQSGSEDE